MGKAIKKAKVILKVKGKTVKEFPDDKGLKVTGKVDEKTAKKLGILNLCV